jgi:hypothetical protein
MLSCLEPLLNIRDTLTPDKLCANVSVLPGVIFLLLHDVTHLYPLPSSLLYTPLTPRPPPCRS